MAWLKTADISWRYHECFPLEITSEEREQNSILMGRAIFLWPWKMVSGRERTINVFDGGGGGVLENFEIDLMEKL